jgi:hypothetical protein
MVKFTDDQLAKIENQKQKAEICSKFFISSYCETPATVTVKIHPLLCHSHYCPICNKIRRNQLYYTLVRWSKNRRLRFLTLTYSHDLTPEQVLQRFQKDWNKYVLYLRRARYYFNYFKVIEFTKKGYVHFHILIDSYIPQGILSRIWLNITEFSYIVYVKEKMSNRKSINYLLKYVTKSFEGAQDIFVAYGIRRYSFSRHSYDFRKETKQTDHNYIFYNRIFPSVDVLKLHYKALYAKKFVTGFVEDYPDLIFL